MQQIKDIHLSINMDSRSLYMARVWNFSARIAHSTRNGSLVLRNIVYLPNFANYYKIDEILGVGGYGKVNWIVLFE